MSEEGPATHVDLTEVTRHLNEAFNTSEAATTGPAIGDVIAELQRRRSSHLELKFVTLYDGSNRCRGERLWRMQVREAGQSSR